MKSLRLDLSSLKAQLVHLGLCMGTGVALYLALIILLRVEEAWDFLQRFMKKIRRRESS